MKMVVHYLLTVFWVVHTVRWVIWFFWWLVLLLWMKLCTGKGICYMCLRWEYTQCCCDEKSLLLDLAMSLLVYLVVSLVVLPELLCVLCRLYNVLHILWCLHPIPANRFSLSQGVAFFQYLCVLREDHEVFFGIVQEVYKLSFLSVVSCCLWLIHPLHPDTGMLCRELHGTCLAIHCGWCGTRCIVLDLFL